MDETPRPASAATWTIPAPRAGAEDAERVDLGHRPVNRGSRFSPKRRRPRRDRRCARRAPGRRLRLQRLGERRVSAAFSSASSTRSTPSDPRRARELAGGIRQAIGGDDRRDNPEPWASPHRAGARPSGSRRRDAGRSADQRACRPESGTSPMRLKAGTKRASSDATTTSAASQADPAPAATPLTAATTGLGGCESPRSGVVFGEDRRKSRSADPPRRSAPAQKPRPAPGDHDGADGLVTGDGLEGAAARGGAGCSAR